MAYDDVIERDASLDPLVPTPVAAEVIQELPKSSAILSLARRAAMSTKTWRTPVLSVLPNAYWVGSDTGLKQTTAQDWENVQLTAEELAVIVVVPEAYLDDSQVPIWSEVRPRLAEAIGAKIDAATLFGTDAPASFPVGGVYGQTLATGNVMVRGAGSTTLAENIAAAGEAVALDGYAANGFAARPGFAWNLVGQKATDGVPIYQPPAGGLPTGLPGSLYGFPFKEVLSGGWDATEAELIAGDWSKAIVGVRQDITMRIFTEGVVSDDSGNVVVNLMQQDSVALRCVFRVGFALARPVTRLNAGDSRSPFFTIQKNTANS